jgi:hypothetical protein
MEYFKQTKARQEPEHNNIWPMFLYGLGMFIAGFLAGRWLA